MVINFWTNSNTVNYVGDFIEGLDNKTKKKFLRQLKLLEKYGYKFVDMKKLKGFDLYEIRIDFKNIAYRIFYVIRNAACWLLHAFIKKSKDTPIREIKTALSRAKDLDAYLLLKVKGV